MGFSNLFLAIDSIINVKFTSLMLEHNTHEYEAFIAYLCCICKKSFTAKQKSKEVKQDIHHLEKRQTMDTVSIYIYIYITTC